MARTAAALLLAAAAAALRGQAPTAAPPHPKHGSEPPAVFRSDPELPPARALAHLRANVQRRLAARQQGARTEPAPAPRPTGAGRHVAAVLVCADADVDVAALLGLLREDLLLVATPAAAADAGIAALLERAVADERLSLVIVLTHAGCASLDATGSTPAAAALRERAEPARALAAQRALPLHRAQGLLERDRLLALSAPLRDAVAADRLRIVPASVTPATGEVTFHTTAAEELPLAPVR